MYICIIIGKSSREFENSNVRELKHDRARENSRKFKESSRKLEKVKGELEKVQGELEKLLIFESSSSREFEIIQETSIEFEQNIPEC
eukprot:1301955-Amorphochlora_amoeboformis.AAC.1